MSTFERVYSEEAIAAAVHSYLDRKIRPARLVIQLAREGNLTTRTGEKVPAFELNPHTFRDFITRERKRRRGPVKGGGMNSLSNPDDVLEGLRRRMIALADSELGVCERQRQGKRDPEHMRQIARLVREVAALPKPGEGRSRTPGDRDANGKMVDGKTTGGIVGKMLNAHRTRPATEPIIEDKAPAENGTEALPEAESAAQSQERSGPGSFNRSDASVLEGEALRRRVPA